MNFSEGRLSAEFTRLYAKRSGYGQRFRKDIEKFQINQTREIFKLSEELRTRAYVPAYCGILIEQKKPDGTIKPRGITPLGSRDWLVQRLVLEELVTITSGKFDSSVSYGRRALKGESCRSPISCCKAIANVRSKMPAAFRADLVEFFPSINRQTILEQILATVPKNWELGWLVERLILTDASPAQKATAEQCVKFWPEGVGVHQGTVLAPFLSNVFMSDWDKMWEDQRDFSVFRYVDDWLVLGADIERVCDYSKLLSTSLPPGAQCHLDKKDKCEFFESNSSITFLGLNISASGKVRPSADAINSFNNKLRDRGSKCDSIVELVFSLRNFCNAWLKYYETAGLDSNTRNRVKNNLMEAVVSGLDRFGVKANLQKKVATLLLDYKPKSAERRDDITEMVVEAHSTDSDTICEIIDRTC